MSNQIPRRFCAPSRGIWVSNPQYLGLHANGPRAVFAMRQTRFIHDESSTSKQQISKSTLVNPPASTRPPILDLPERSPDQSSIKYYFLLGKGYVKFFRDGLKAINTNRKLVNETFKKTPKEDRPSIFKPSVLPRTFSRAEWVLMWRTRHDLVRLPIFGVMLTVLGEFTALVVVFVGGVVPYTCRIPKQIFRSLEKAEQRRKTAFEELENKHPQGVLSPGVNASVAQSHAMKTLDISGSIWDRVGFSPPGLWQIKGQLRMAYLEGDNQKLIQDGGPSELELDELRIACSERGINILGKSETELRTWLGDWLRLTAAEESAERRRRMATLILTRYINPYGIPRHGRALTDWLTHDTDLRTGPNSGTLQSLSGTSKYYLPSPSSSEISCFFPTVQGK